MRDLLARPPARVALTALVALAVLVNAWNLWPLPARQAVDAAGISYRAGSAYAFALDSMKGLVDSGGDSLESPSVSTLVLLENGKYLGPSRAPHQGIADAGRGAYSHWGNAVIFSTSDNSDPRTNRRAYEVRYSVGPARWLVRLSRLALLACIALACWLSPRFRQRAAAATLPALLAIASLATLTHFIPVPGRVTTEPTVPGTQAQAGDFGLGDRPGTQSFIPFERLVAPFMIVPSATDATQASGLRVRQGDMELREVRSRDEWLAARDAVFLDADRMEGDKIIAYLPPGPSESHAPLIIEYRARVTDGATAVLWGIFALALLTALVARRLATRAAMPRGLLVSCVALALAGLSLLALNLAGTLMPPRRPDSEARFQDHDLKGGRRVAWPGLDSLDRELAPRSGERAEDYVARVNDLVAHEVTHIWNYANASTLELHIPPWRNYILWALGETDPNLYRYHYAAWRPAIERGAGMCSQATLIDVGILREHGYDARVVQLTGHTVATVEVSPGQWHVLDPDIGTVIPRSLDAIERDPESVRAIYQEAYERNGILDPIYAAGIIVGFYGKGGNYVEPMNGNEMLGEDWGRRERLAATLKWAIPIALLALSGALAGAGAALRRARALRGPTNV